MMWTLLLTLACGAGEPSDAPTPAPAAAPAALPDIDVAALQPRVAAGTIFVLDVRTAGEFASGHVPGAVNIPVTELEGRLAELEGRKGDEIAVICASGNRSRTATAILRQQGFSGALNVPGGTSAWKKAGFSVE